MPGGPGETLREIARSTADIRAANVERICRLLRERGDLSRAELVRASGLTRPTVIAIVTQLMDDGLVVETGAVRATGAGGRPGALLRFRADARVVAVVRYRGANLETSLTDVSGTVLAVSARPRVPETRRWQEVVSTVVDATRELRMLHPHLGPVVAAGASLPGAVDARRGLWTPRPNSPWQAVPLGRALGEALGCPVRIVNVAAATLIGQLATEGDRASANAALVYVGKGIGSAALADGRLIRGAAGAAGELGHCVLPGGRWRCRCGQRGCVEAVTAEPFLRREFRRLTGASAPSLLAMEERADGSRSPTGGGGTVDAAVADMLDTAADILGTAASWLVDLTDPDVLYLRGGPFTSGSSRFFDAVTATVRRLSYGPPDRPEIVRVVDDVTLAGTVRTVTEHLPAPLRTPLRTGS